MRAEQNGRQQTEDESCEYYVSKGKHRSEDFSCTVQSVHSVCIQEYNYNCAPINSTTRRVTGAPAYAATVILLFSYD